MSILINNGDGTYAPKTLWPVDLDAQSVSEPVDVVCCDVNGDTLPDLVSVNHTSDDVSVLLNEGNAQFDAPVKYTVGEAPFGIACLYLDGANGNDLITNGFTEDAISVLLNSGAGVFAAHVTYATGDAPRAMALCDVDGDNDQDVVTANMLGKSVSVLRNNSDGSFTNIGTAALCSTPQACVNPFDIVCCDLDGFDGPDIATANGIADSVTLLFNNGSGVFSGYTSYGGVDGAFSLACCDLDGDSHADAVSANLTSDDLAMFLNSGGGGLGPLSFLPVGTGSDADPSSVLCCDVDGDGDLDLVNTFVDGLTLFENDCAGGTCGDGVVGAGEACDDGFFDSCGSCNATCDGAGSGSTCGDGDVCFEVEECDDSNTTPGDGCSADCLSEVECSPPAAALGSGRYLGVDLAAIPGLVALQVDGASVDTSCVEAKYVALDGSLNDVPVFQAGTQWGEIYIHSPLIIPDAVYDIRTNCGGVFSTPVRIVTYAFADVNDTIGVVDLDDILLILAGFTGNYSAASFEQLNLFPCDPGTSITGVIDLDDILLVLAAFSGAGYDDTTGCPPPCP